MQRLDCIRPKLATSYDNSLIRFYETTAIHSTKKVHSQFSVPRNIMSATISSKKNIQKKSEPKNITLTSISTKKRRQPALMKVDHHNIRRQNHNTVSHIRSIPYHKTHLKNHHSLYHFATMSVSNGDVKNANKTEHTISQQQATLQASTTTVTWMGYHKTHASSVKKQGEGALHSEQCTVNIPAVPQA